MKGWLAACIICMAAAAVLVLLLNRRPETKPALTGRPVVLETSAPVRITTPVAAPSLSTSAVTPPVTNRPQEAPVAAVPTNQPGSQPATQPGTAAPTDNAGISIGAATALENTRTALREYGLKFGGNPVGNNAEITKALNGGNPKQISFLRPDAGYTVSANGELLDSWGTPYFFHQLSAKETEIRSAGPDRKMWTEDDLVTK